jgi:hypothetical protein
VFRSSACSACREITISIKNAAFWRRLSSITDEPLVERAIAGAPGNVAGPLVESEAWAVLVQAMEWGLEPGSIADLLARRDPEDLALWDYVLEDYDQEIAEYLGTAKGVRPETLILGAASLPRKHLKVVSLRRRMMAARVAHGRTDAVAQQAAARLFAMALGDSGETARKLLIECFGPTQRALEQRTLAPKAWLELEAVLPASKAKSKGKAERLHQGLVANMERHDWTRADFTRALEPAGPEAQRMVKLVNKKHPLRRLMEGAVDEVKGLRG